MQHPRWEVMYMAVRIRLKRMGAKKRPFYRLVVADARAARDGAFIESIGYYNPIADPAEIEIDEEKALDWLKKGARPSDTAKSLLKRAGVMDKFAASRKEG
jgi:small subunit ribosomal protein S16